MRNGALSVLRARQLIITMPRKQLIVLSWTLATSGLPHVTGCPKDSVQKAETVESASLFILDRLV
jgi:hypothetical protein